MVLLNNTVKIHNVICLYNMDITNFSTFCIIQIPAEGTNSEIDVSIYSVIQGRLNLFNFNIWTSKLRATFILKYVDVFSCVGIG